MDIDVREVWRTRDMGLESLDLDSPAFDDDGEKTLQTMIEDPHAAGPEEQVDHREVRAGVRSALASLTPREARILRLYFGLDGSHPLTLKEIGSIYDLSRERIRQIKDRAMSRLAAGRRGRRLRALV
jgi:RNA polymerase primary sigma factor